ncbi:Uncharacterised protein [Mycobacteroides abscessus subsp. abscessus]|nr:Uncharacterised protein [Mycobacteroides abscessus subsp. abscessus]SLD59125.1 Uncharacterised protein [Mycobacteroides abscessus subsp. massiliense]
MRRFDGGDDALGARKQQEGIHGLAVGDRAVVRAPALAQPGVLGSNSRVVQTG